MMKSRTSCFNKALFHKNMTRFAPVGVLYALCLMLGLLLLLSGGDRQYYFTANLIGSMSVMAAVNLCFAPLMAQLLFGDLYNSRMCNGLHAMPVRRDELFVTNLISGLTFSLVPTALFSLVTLPLLAISIVENSGMLALYWFACTNLQFVCCFGIAVLATMCAGNRFGMLAVYAMVQFGAYLAGLVVETCYIPLLSGVESSGQLSRLLTPIMQLGEAPVELQEYFLLKWLFYSRESEMTATFTLNTAAWQGLTVWAAAGVGMMGISWLLYRKRDLESAGDPVAVPALIPVLQVLSSLALGFLVALVVLFVLNGVPNLLVYSILLAGIAVAWFAVKMVLSRTSRVFEKKNFLHLIPVLLVVALSIAATYFDVLDVVHWTPKAENVRSVYIYSNGEQCTLTETEDVETVIRLHALALEEGLESSGYYSRELLEQGLPLEEVAQQTRGLDYNYVNYRNSSQFRRAVSISVCYTMDSGREVKRFLYLWADSEAGELMRELFSDWDSYYQTKQNRGCYSGVSFDIQQVEYLYSDGLDTPNNRIACTPEMASSLLEALRADREAGNLVDLNSFHQGYFAREDESYNSSVQINLYYGPPAKHLWSFNLNFDVYPDSENTIAWLQEHDLLSWEIVFPE